MKLRLSILLLAAALAASPAAGQTVKSLGYNTTNGNIVAATNVTFTNSVGFATNARAATRTNLGATTVGNALFTAVTTNSARTALGASIVGGNIFTVPEQYQELYLRINADNTVSSLTPAATRTNLGLGTTNAVTFSNITASGTLTATGDAALNGVNNTMPNATTADLASSLMTRDLVGQEFANPRNKFQMTYWFGLEGQGYWTTVGTNATTRQSGTAAGFGGGIYIFSTTRIGANVAGAGLRSFNDADFGSSPYRFSDGGALTMRARVRKNSVVDRPAFAFLMGIRTATQMWQENAYGLYFVPQPTNSWVSNAVVTQHSRIAVSNVVWAVSTAGTNGATEPTWTDLIGSLVTNGSAVYVNAGPHTSDNWVLAIGSTNASQVVMTNTGKLGPTSGGRAEVVLKLRTLGTTNTPYTVYGSVENTAGESTEVSLTTTNNDGRGPQFWSRPDEASGGNADMQIRYISIDGQLGSL